MSTTIDWLITQTELPDFTYIAGSGGGSRVISGVNMLDNPDTLPWLKTGDLIITTGYFFQSNPTIVQSFIVQLKERGCSGLGIKLNRYIDHLPEEILHQADQLQFPILAIPFSSSMEQINRIVYRHIFQEEYSEHQLQTEKYRSLVDAALKNQSLMHLLALLSQYLSCPTYLTDEQLFCLECSDTTQNNLKTGICLFEQADANHIRSAQIQHNVPFIRFSSLWDGRAEPVTVMPLKNRQTIMGYLVIHEEKSSLKSADFELLNGAYSLLCLAMMRSLQAARSYALTQDELLLPLFTDAALPDSSRRFQCIQQGIPFHGNHLLAQVRPVQSPVPRVKLRQHCDRLRDYLGTDTAYCKITAIFTGHGLLVYFYFPTEQQTSRCERYAVTCCQQLLSHDAAQFPCTIALSSCMTDADTLPVCFQQTEQMFDLASKLDAETNLHLYSANYTLYQLASVLSAVQLNRFYNGVLGDLERYDTENHTNLMELLEVYQRNAGNTRQTAQELYIHRNTAIYKLRQISDILGYDIREVSRLHTLQTAFLIQKLLAL